MHAALKGSAARLYTSSSKATLVCSADKNQPLPFPEHKQQHPTQLQIGIVSRNDLAKSPLRCNDATDSFESYVPSGVSGAEWKSVNITDMPYSAQLMWGLGQYSLPIQAYHHYLDGAKQDGIFLGAHNVTSWAVQLQDGSAGSAGQPYWLIRLLGPDSADPVTGAELDDGEYKTFIRIYGS